MTSEPAKPIPSAATLKELRSFGFTFGVVAAIFGSFLLFRGKVSAPWVLSVSAAFFLVGALLPGVLRPAYGPWMKFAEALGYVNTRILLGVFYYLGMTPTGLLMRLSGKDPMTRTFKSKNAASYWARPTPHSEGARHFDRQF